MLQYARIEDHIVLTLSGSENVGFQEFRDLAVVFEQPLGVLDRRPGKVHCGYTESACASQGEALPACAATSFQHTTAFRK